MVDTKIARPSDGRQKNKSPKEGTDGELYGWQMDGTKITRQGDGRIERVKWLAQN